MLRFCLLETPSRAHFLELYFQTSLTKVTRIHLFKFSEEIAVELTHGPHAYWESSKIVMFPPSQQVPLTLEAPVTYACSKETPPPSPDGPLSGQRLSPQC